MKSQPLTAVVQSKAKEPQWRPRSSLWGVGGSGPTVRSGAKEEVNEWLPDVGRGAGSGFEALCKLKKAADMRSDSRPFTRDW